MLAPGLLAPEPEARRAALIRWVVMTAVWQVLVLAIAAAFVILRAAAHDRSLVWVAPPVAAIVGNGIALQLGVGRIAREALR